MSDSTEASYARTDFTGVAPAAGDRVGLERVTRPAIPTFDWSDDPQAKHTSSLIKLGAVQQAKGNHAEAETLFREALDIGERVLRPDDPRLLPALSSVACACISRGASGEAESLIARLLTISESNRGQDHPDLVIILNDLTRVCLRHSAHGMAEPVLLRLAAIKRSKGEDHPEVATVLASLAVVRQALGRHESAEQLWRRVLAIRERTLAPNHFALATTLEHLAEACAARGKTGEALRLFGRAQEIRELTLGPDHVSVRTSRERIADLQLQGSDDFPDSPDASADVRRGVSPPEGFSLPSAMISDIPPRERPSADPPAARRPRRGTRVLERPRQEEPARESEAVVGLAVPAPTTEVAHPIAFGVPYADLLDRPEQKPPYTDEADEDVGALNRFLARSIDLLWRGRTAAVVAVAVAAVFIGVMANDSRAWSETEEPVSETIPERQDPALVLNSRAPLPQVSAGPTEEPKSSAAAPALASASAAAPRPRTIEQRSPVRSTSERTTAPPRISIPSVASTLMTGFDSALQARPDPLRGIGASAPTVELPPVSRDVFRGNPVEREAPAVALQRPRLIGAVPTPRYPNQLVDVRGEVRVRFDVDTLGRPVMSSLTVVHSPHMLLTAEVLKLISGLRFEPARSVPDGKAMKDAVQLGFQFGPNK